MATFSLLLAALLFYTECCVGVPPLPAVGVRLYQNQELPDFSMIDEDTFAQNNLWCQSSVISNSTVGAWYFPDGTPVPSHQSMNLPFYVNHSNGQIGLIRRTQSIINYQGLYTCIIQNEMGNNETLVAAIYRNTEYTSAESPVVDGNIRFNLLSTRNINPPMFSLIFNVTKRPPTYVTCTINSVPCLLESSDISRVVLNSVHPNIKVQVNVTFQTRSTGAYQFNISNARVDFMNVLPAYPSIIITETGTPLNLTVTRLNLTSAIIKWSPPSDTPAGSQLKGYEIFYEPSNSANLFSQVVGNDTHQVTISFIQLNENYKVSVVAYGDNLPSNASNAVEISTDVTFNMSDVIESPFIGQANVTICCQVSINYPNISFSVAWVDQELNVLSGYSTAVTSSSNSIALIKAEPKNPGVYTCVANFSQSYVFNETYTLVLQVPSPNVSILLTPGNTVYERGHVLINCSVHLLPDVEITVNWLGMHGLLGSNASYAIRNMLFNDTMIYSSTLNITSLSIQQNFTTYTCMFEIRANYSNEYYNMFITPANVSTTSDPIIVKVLPTINPVITATTNRTPVLNETFTITCSVTTVEPELAQSLSIEWTYNGSTVLDNGITETHNSNTSVNLSFSALKVAYLGEYTCISILYISSVPEPVVNTDRYTLNITVLQTLNVTVYVSNNESLIEGTYADLICTATDLDSTIDTVANWYYNGQLIDASGAEYTTSKNGSKHMLHINELRLSRDNNGQYTCSVSVNNQFITGIESSNDTITLSVTRFNIIVYINNYSIPTIGDLFTPTCSVALPEQFVRVPDIAWAEETPDDYYPVSNTRMGNIINSNNIVSRTLSFNPLHASDIRKYRCTASFNGNQQSVELDIQFLLPPPQLVIDVGIVPIYESTQFTLTCTMSLPSAVDVHTIVPAAHWTNSNGQIINTSNRIMTNTNDHITTLTFSPIDNGDHSQYNDTGEYTCHFNVLLQDPIVVSSQNKTSVYIEVLDLPQIQLNISTSGSSDFRHDFYLMCAVQKIRGVPINVAWLDETMNSLPVSNQSTENEIIMIVELKNLTYSMSGTYSCVAGYNVSLTNDMDQVQRQYTLNVSAFGVPRDFEIIGVSPFSINLTWSTPNTTNVSLIGYQLYIEFNNGSIGLAIPLNISQTNYTLYGLSPYQLIEVSISAIYSIGEGSRSSTLKLFTSQYDPGLIRNLTVSSVNSESLISWSPPLDPNGIILHYKLTIFKYGNNELVRSVNVTNTNYTTNRLEQGVAYVVVVQAVNGAALGEPVNYIFFVKEEAPPPVPDIKVSRINGTHMYVSWSLLLLNESRGFIQNYTIQISRIDNRKRELQSPLVLSNNESDATIAGLNPTTSYSVAVFATSNGGTGALTINIANRPETLSFQLRARSFETCTQWTASTREDIKSLIRSEVTLKIVQNCTCGFQENYISGEVLSCDDRFLNDAFYRANITSYGSISSAYFLELIQYWINTSPNVTNSSITFDSTCPVEYISNEEAFCGIPSPAELQLVPIIIVVVLLSSLFVILIITAILIITMCWQRKTKLLEGMSLKIDKNKYQVEMGEFGGADDDKIYEELDSDGYIPMASVRINSSTTSLINNGTMLHDYQNINFEEIRNESQPVQITQTELNNNVCALQRGSITSSPLPPLPVSESLPIKIESPILPSRNQTFNRHQGGTNGRLSLINTGSAPPFSNEANKFPSTLPGSYHFRFSGISKSSQLSFAQSIPEQPYETPVSSVSPLELKSPEYAEPLSHMKSHSSSPWSEQPYETPISLSPTSKTSFSPNDQKELTKFPYTEEDDYSVPLSPRYIDTMTMRSINKNLPSPSKSPVYSAPAEPQIYLTPVTSKTAEIHQETSSPDAENKSQHDSSSPDVENKSQHDSPFPDVEIHQQDKIQHDSSSPDVEIHQQDKIQHDSSSPDVEIHQQDKIQHDSSSPGVKIQQDKIQHDSSSPDVEIHQQDKSQHDSSSPGVEIHQQDKIQHDSSSPDVEIHQQDKIQHDSSSPDVEIHQQDKIQHDSSSPDVEIQQDKIQHDSSSPDVEIH